MTENKFSVAVVVSQCERTLNIITFCYDAHFSVAVAGTIGCSAHNMPTLNGGKQGFCFVVVVAVSTNLKCEQTFTVIMDLLTVRYIYLGFVMYPNLIRQGKMTTCQDNVTLWCTKRTG